MWLYHLAFSPAMNKRDFLLLQIFSSFGMVSDPDFGHSIRYVAISHCFILHSFVIYDVEHLLICLFGICVSLMHCLLRSLAYFSIRLFVVISLRFKNSLCISDNNPCISWKYFFPNLSFVFSFSWYSFTDQKFFILMKFNLFIYCLFVF